MRHTSSFCNETTKFYPAGLQGIASLPPPGFPRTPTKPSARLTETQTKLRSSPTKAPLQALPAFPTSSARAPHIPTRTPPVGGQRQQIPSRALPASQQPPTSTSAAHPAPVFGISQLTGEQQPAQPGPRVHNSSAPALPPASLPLAHPPKTSLAPPASGASKLQPPSATPALPSVSPPSAHAPQSAPSLKPDRPSIDVERLRKLPNRILDVLPPTLHGLPQPPPHLAHMSMPAAKVEHPREPLDPLARRSLSPLSPVPEDPSESPSFDKSPGDSFQPAAEATGGNDDDPMSPKEPTSHPPSGGSPELDVVGADSDHPVSAKESSLQSPPTTNTNSNKRAQTDEGDLTLPAAHPSKKARFELDPPKRKIDDALPNDSDSPEAKRLKLTHPVEENGSGRGAAESEKNLAPPTPPTSSDVPTGSSGTLLPDWHQS